MRARLGKAKGRWRKGERLKEKGRIRKDNGR